MSRSDIHPEQIIRPFQLIAATLVLVLALDTAFLAAAAQIDRPSWASAALVIAAILYPPALLGGAFVLQTRFRGQMLGDEHFIEWWLASLKQTNDAARIDLTRVSAGLAEAMVRPDYQERIRSSAARLETALDERSDDVAPEILASASLELGRAAMAQEAWEAAATHLSVYIKVRPDDWAAVFALGAAYANQRGGSLMDRLAFESFSRALDHRPADLEPQIVVRMRSFRAAMLKRLGMLDEAAVELAAASSDVRPGSYEADDILYNMACVHALKGQASEAIAALKRIEDPRFMWSVSAHVDDYFAKVQDAPEFRSFMESSVQSWDAPIGNDPRRVPPP